MASSTSTALLLKSMPLSLNPMALSTLDKKRESKESLTNDILKGDQYYYGADESKKHYALTHYQNAVALQPDLNVFVKICRLLEMAGDYDEALSVIDQAMKYFQNSPDLYWRKGHILFYGLGLLAKALETYEEGLLHDPYHFLIIVDKTNVLEKMGNYAEALTCIESILESHADNVDLLKMAGNLCSKQGLHSDALYLFHTAKSYAKVADGYLDLSIKREEKLVAVSYFGENTVSLQKLQKYFTHPTAFVLFQNGNKAHLNGEYSQAKAHYESALRLDASCGNIVWEKIGDMERLQGLYEPALASYAKILKINAIVHNKMGLCYKILGQHSLARSQFEKALQQLGHNSYCYENIGVTYIREGRNIERAIFYFKEALKHEKDSKKQLTLNIKVGRAYLTLNQYHTAETYFKKAEEIQPDDEQVKYYLEYLSRLREKQKKINRKSSSLEQPAELEVAAVEEIKSEEYKDNFDWDAGRIIFVESRLPKAAKLFAAASRAEDSKSLEHLTQLLRPFQDESNKHKLKTLSDAQGRTILMAACYPPEVIRLLMQHGADCRTVFQGLSPLHLYVKQNNVAGVKELLKFPVDINKKSGPRADKFSDKTALQQACMVPSVALVKCLIEAKADMASFQPPLIILVVNQIAARVNEVGDRYEQLKSDQTIIELKKILKLLFKTQATEALLKQYTVMEIWKVVSLINCFPLIKELVDLFDSSIPLRYFTPKVSPKKKGLPSVSTDLSFILLNEYLTMKHESVLLIWEKALQLTRENSLQQAVVELKRAIQLQPNMLMFSEQLIQILIRSSRWDEAYEQVNKVLSYYPYDASFLYCRSLILFSKAKDNSNSSMLLQALQDITTVIDTSTAGLGAYGWRARILFGLKRFEEALINLHYILKEDPQDFQANELLGHIYYSNQRPEMALKYILKAAAVLDNNDINLYNTNLHTSSAMASKKGILYGLLRMCPHLYIATFQPEKALEVCNRILNERPQDLRVLLDKATALRKLNQFKKAEDIYSEVYQLIGSPREGTIQLWLDMQLERVKLRRQLVKDNNFTQPIIDCIAMIHVLHSSFYQNDKLDLTPEGLLFIQQQDVTSWLIKFLDEWVEMLLVCSESNNESAQDVSYAIVILEEMLKIKKDKSVYLKLIEAHLKTGSLLSGNEQAHHYQKAVFYFENFAGYPFSTSMYQRIGDTYQTLAEHAKKGKEHQQHREYLLNAIACYETYFNYQFSAAIIIKVARLKEQAGCWVDDIINWMNDAAKCIPSHIEEKRAKSDYELIKEEIEALKQVRKKSLSNLTRSTSFDSTFFNHEAYRAAHHHHLAVTNTEEKKNGESQRRLSFST
jgi:tetratricopeptide (TPR) repeat protein